jgi:hypothetical protein
MTRATSDHQIPNFLRMRQNSIRASCVANQRNVAQASTLYVNDSGMINGVFNVGTLQPAGYVNLKVCECPQSTMADYDDYQVTVVNTRVTDIRCSVNNAGHDWTGLN